MARQNIAIWAGKRDKAVTMIPLVQTQGPSNFPVETDDPDGQIEFYASREDVQPTERMAEMFRLDQVSAAFHTKWGLPYVEAIDPDVVDVPKAFVLVHRGRRYDILNASMIGQRTGVELLTLARQG